MGWLQSFSDFSWNALTGTLSDAQLAKVEQQAREGVRRAGGTLEQQQAAADEVRGYVHRYYPSRDPLDTLVDDFSGDPLGTGNGSDLSFALIAGAGVLLLLLVLLVVVRR